MGDALAPHSGSGEILGSGNVLIGGRDMYDLKLDNTGDLEISEAGDVMLTESVR